MTMNNLKITFFVLILFSVFNVSAQLELDGDSEHSISYEVRNDSVIIYVDVFNDFSIDLNSDENIDAADDYVYLMFDLNKNGAIDLGVNKIDLYYTYDTAQTNNICNGNIESPSSVNSCQSTTGGFASAVLKATPNNSTPHLFYTFSIPKDELDYGSSSSLCGRISAKVHTGGTALDDEVTFPEQTGTDNYFVDPYNSIQLYPEAVITLPTGQTAPNDVAVAVCAGDTLKVSEDYPDFNWSGFSKNYYQVVLDIPTQEYYFKITDKNDQNCVITDTIAVNLLDKKLCKGAYVFPNIVTPNGDFVNDVFELMISQELKDQDASFWKGSKLKIFNRWGFLVYSTKKGLLGEHPRWDCRTEYGKLVTSGTYYYTYITPGDTPQRINGFFTVIHSE